jgi:dimethylargininase
MLGSEGERLTRVVVCTPGDGYCNAHNLEKHNIIESPDRDRAIEQHDALKDCLRTFGAEVIDVPELPGHPNSVFTRDTALCTRLGYIELRMGLETRRGEEEWMSRILVSLGEPLFGRIEAPGTVEGGDVILAGSVAFVGHSIRTNEAGVEQLASFLTAFDYDVRVIPLPDSILHLDKVLMLAGPDRAIYCRDLIPKDSLRGLDMIEVVCGAGVSANIICLGGNEVIVERSNRTVAKHLEARGVVIHQLDLSEFVKGSGGPNCLILPVERG